MKKLIIIFVVFIILFLGCVNDSVLKDEGIYAVFYTNMGKFICKLFYEKTPITVGNFISLAEGTKEFTDLKTKEKVKRPFYNGLIFYGVIKDKVIQGGCPLGIGNEGPGYKFVDEFDETLKHNAEGILSMSNDGYPNSNGSRFYFALVPFSFLDNKNTVFGKVVSNIDILKKISNVRVDDNYKPYNDIFIKKIKIIRKGEKAKGFDAVAAFKKNEEALAKYNKEKENQRLELLNYLGVKEDKIITTKIGLQYYIKKNGYGKKPNKGDLIKAHYTGYLADGTVFDSSYQRNDPIETIIGVGKVIPGWDEAFLTMKEGEKRVLILPDYLGYGEYGHPPVIPPRSTLIFDVELISVTRK
jgi:peptidyl-prolyl cis-trans isomerase A (cyclophilin A)